MKQRLQNLREEIKQLGREIRAQLKGELLGPQIEPSLWSYPTAGITGECVAQKGQ